MCRSVRHTPQARTRSRTCPERTRGSATSRIWSGLWAIGSGEERTAAFISVHAQAYDARFRTRGALTGSRVLDKKERIPKVAVIKRKLRDNLTSKPPNVPKVWKSHGRTGLLRPPICLDFAHNRK